MSTYADLNTVSDLGVAPAKNHVTALGARFDDPAGLATDAGFPHIADYSSSAVRAVDVAVPTATQQDTWGRLRALYR